MKAKEGTNFILLHFVCFPVFDRANDSNRRQWFHTLIVLLHQPTLLNSFGGTIQHLYPNSRELSMSSAKTIADILSFSELVDGKSFIGNPFTSQPMYIAACAFLMESAYYSSPSSRPTSPYPQPLLANQSSGFVMPSMESSNASERKSTAKHILLASAAKENYQRCYKALKALNTYWEGTGYILTVLDQKAKGIVDPLLYTAEDMENTAENTPLGTAGWCGPKAPTDAIPSSERPHGVSDIPPDGKWSPKFDPSQGKHNQLRTFTAPLTKHSVLFSAIGWALTGATNSSQPNLSLLYQMPTTETETSPNKIAYSSQYSHSYSTLPVQSNPAQSSNSSFPHLVNQSRVHDEDRATSLATSNAKYPQLPPRAMNNDPPYYLGMTSPFPEANSRSSITAQSSYNQGLSSSQMDSHPSAYTYPVHPATVAADHHGNNSHMNSGGHDLQLSMNPHGGGMMIESHDVDMNTLQHQDSFPFSNGEILPWLEYLPQDVLSFFGENHNFPLFSPDGSTPRPPP